MTRKSVFGSVRVACLVLTGAFAVDGCSENKSPSTKNGPISEIQVALGTSPGSWTERGPISITNFGAQATPDEVSGAMQTFVVDPANADKAIMGAVNGGIWTTTNFTSATPTWTPRTDQQTSLSIIEMEMDPTNSQVIAAVTGGRSSFGFVGGINGNILISKDGGTTWTNQQLPTGESLTGVSIRGQIVLEAGDQCNVFRITNQGTSFTNIVGGTSGLNGLGAIWHLQPDRSNATRYYLVAQGGVFRSNDSGATWVNVSVNDHGATGLATVLSTSDNAEMALGSDGHLYVAVSNRGAVLTVAHTTNQGASWTHFDSPRFTDPGQVSPNTIASASNTTPIVITTTVADHGLGVNNSFVVGRDLIRVRISGVTGNTAANGDLIAGPAPPATPGGPAPTNQFVLFTELTHANSVGNGNGTGGTWQHFITPNPNGQGGVHLSIAVDPSNSNIMYFGGDAGQGEFGGETTLLRGNPLVAPTNGIPSPQWANIIGVNVPEIPGGGTATNTSPHADSRKMRIDAAGNLIEGSDGGIYRRTSPQTNEGDWTTLNRLGTTEIHDVAWDPVAGLLFGGMQDNGTAAQSAFNNAAWPEIEGADGGDCASVSIGGGQAFRYTSGQGLGGFTRWVFQGSTAISAVNPAVHVIGSSPSQNLFQVDQNLPFVTHYATNQQNSNRLVIGGSVNWWESADQAENIQAIGTIPANNFVNDMAYGHPLNPDALWSAGNGVFARFTAGGNLTATVPAFPTGDASDVVMAPSDPTKAYVTGFGGSVWVTQVSGGVRTWTNITGDLTQQAPPRVLRSIVYVPSATGDRLIVGGDGGVFVTSAATPGTWARLGTNLPRALVFDMDYDASRDRLVAGTMGRGAWTIEAVSTLNRAPIARCRNVTVSANGQCLGPVTPAQIDNGSSDPDGNPITLSVAPPSPYNLGTTSVTLTVTDNQGTSATCTALVTVVDTTPPVFGPITNQTTVLCDPNSEAVHVTVPTATDNCAHPPTVTGQVTASSDASLTLPINVVNGTVTLSAGTFTITWTASDGTNTTTATQTVTIRGGIYATQAASVLDRSILRLPNGAAATLINSGTGTTQIANDARTGDILSRGPVTIGDRAVITGSVRSGGTVTRNPNGGSVVTGGIFQNQTLTFPPPLVITPTFPNTNNGDFTVNPDQTRAVTPAAYNNFTVFSRGTAQLRAGTYFFNQFDLEPQAVLSINQSAGTILVEVRNSMIWRGTDVLAGGTFTGFRFGYFGTQATILENNFTGILVGPNASVTLGSADGGETFTGQFYVRTLVVRPDVNVVCREDF